MALAMEEFKSGLRILQYKASLGGEASRFSEVLIWRFVMIKAVLFDFDGTVADSSKGIMECALDTVETIGYDRNRYSTDYLKRFIGPPLRDCFKITFDVSDDKIDECVETYRRLYNSKGMFMMNVYPGIKELLNSLRSIGIKTAIATNKMEELAKRCIAYLGLEDSFDAICGPSIDGSISKKKVIENALSTLDVKPSEAIMVGDTSNDEDGARGAGVGFLAVEWGFGFSVSNPNSLELMKEPSDVLKRILEINNKEKKMIERVNTENAPKAVGPYSQAVKANGFMFVSGVLALDPKSGNLVGETASEQAKQIFKNARAIIEEGGAKFENTVKTVVYLTDIADFASVNEVYADAFSSSEVLPARCAFEVVKLPKGGLVEIEFTVAL